MRNAREATRRPVVRSVVGLTVVGALILMGAATAAAVAPPTPGPPTDVTITAPHPNRVCSGDTAIVSWTPPTGRGSKRITGYEVQVSYQWEDPPGGPIYYVGPGVTSQTVPLVIGDVAVIVWPETASGLGTPAIASIFVESPPLPVEFWSGGVTADHTVTMNLGWSDEEQLRGPGGRFSDTTITLTRSDGAHYRYTPTQDTQQLVFDHLKDTTEYTWSTSAHNRCGTTVGYDTPGFRPGIAPSFTRATPPPDATAGVRYHYWFHASGKELPTYALVDAPAWLTIDAATGAVTGVPPAGTTDFSFAVEASNQVGQDFGGGTHSNVFTDTFSVTVSSAMLAST